jgi:hypothetical protein
MREGWRKTRRRMTDEEVADVDEDFVGVSHDMLELGELGKGDPFEGMDLELDFEQEDESQYVAILRPFNRHQRFPRHHDTDEEDSYAVVMCLLSIPPSLFSVISQKQSITRWS